MWEPLNADTFLVVQVHATVNTEIGDYVYRIGQPAQAMGKIPGIMVINLTSMSPFLKAICLRADVLVLHLIGEQDMLPIVAERKRRGLATVFEISDNFLAFPPCANIKSWFNDPINLATTFQLIQLSDAIQGVSEILLEQFRFLHDHRVVFENQIMEMGAIQETSRNEVVMGWGGSVGHTEDIKAIAPVIQNICQVYPNVRFSFMGNKRQYEQVFGSVVNQQFLYTEPGNLSDYYTFLDGLDIGLAPLLATPYNECRSDVKFIEYASRGVVPVVSDVGPYKKNARHGVNAFLFADAESLRNTLEMLINDRSLRQKIKEKAYNYVKNERWEDIRAAERIAFYKDVAQNRSSGKLPTKLLEALSQGTQAYKVKQTSAERKVIKGAYLESEGRTEKARALWLEAARELPEYYFPLFCAANSLMKNNKEKAIENFRLALTINPESLRSRYLLGKALKMKQKEAAREAFKEALQIFPDYAPAWRELAILEKEQGSLEEAGRLMNKALEANPFYASAASELGEIYLAQERKNPAIEAFRVAANLIPDNPDYQRQVIEALMEAGSFDEAGQECLDYLKSYPHASEFYGMLAKILGSQGKPKEALLAGKMADQHRD